MELVADKQAVIFSQPAGLAEIDLALLVQPRHHIHPARRQDGQGGVLAIGAVTQEDVPGFELVPQLAEQPQIVVVEAAPDRVEHRAAVEAKADRQLQDGKAATGFLGGGLGMALLVFRGVGQLGGGAIHGDDGAVPAWPVRLRAACAVAGLHIGRIPLLHRVQTLLAAEGLHLPHDLAAGGFGLQHLPEETLAGQPQAEDVLPAVGSLLLGGEQRGRQEIAQVLLELGQRGLADGLGGAAAAGGQPGAEGGEAGGHNKFIYSLG